MHPCRRNTALKILHEVREHHRGTRPNRFQRNLEQDCFPNRFAPSLRCCLEYQAYQVFTPFTRVALMRLAEGLLIPATSRRYSRASAAEPLATAVACDVPLNSMYIERCCCVFRLRILNRQHFASSALAEQMPSPEQQGRLDSPSSVGPCDEEALTLPLLLEPMERTFFAVPGQSLLMHPRLRYHPQKRQEVSTDCLKHIGLRS